MTKPNQPEDFWRRVSTGARSECWPWLGGRQSRGYGCVGYKGELWQAHRLAYVLAGGTLAPDDVILHECDNPACCNPQHLSKGTQQDNIADATQKGRMAHGERHRCARLRSAEVKEMRQLISAGA